MPWWLIGLIVLAAGYAFFALFAWLAADSILFQPRGASYDQSLPGYLAISRSDGPPIAAVHLPNPTATLTLIYFHGNAEDLGDLHPRLVALRDAGFSVVAFDFQGYGLTTGEPGEAAVYADTAAVFAYVTGPLRVPKSHVVLYGFSLGAGGAVDLATREPVSGLILQGAFVSAFRTVTGVSLLPWDRFRNLEKLPHVHCPVLVMHGRGDPTVPFAHGRALFAAASEPKQCLWVDAAGHNNLADVAGARYWETLAGFRNLVEANAR